MDLLAPCRSCLACLPFFHCEREEEQYQRQQKLEASPASPVARELPAQETLAATSEGEKTSSAVYDVAKQSTSEIIIADPVTGIESTSSTEVIQQVSPHKNDRPYPLPFINDVDFSTAGLKPPTSPATPAPFGTVYEPGKADHQSHVHKQQKNNHGHNHGHRGQHGHGGHGHGNHGGHGHNHGHHGHEHKHEDQDPKNVKENENSHNDENGTPKPGEDHTSPPEHDHEENHVDNHHHHEECSSSAAEIGVVETAIVTQEVTTDQIDVAIVKADEKVEEACEVTA